MSRSYLPAPLPPNEQDRHLALQRYNILDTLPESSIDDLNLIAAQICEVPIALVSLVDRDRQWFKAKCGLETSETPREVSFCGHAILQPDEIFEIRDALEDERFAGNPLVTGEPFIRFYAGAPLVTQDGYALGSLCVIDRQPRVLSSTQRNSLVALARQVVDQFDARLTVTQLQETIAELHETRLSAVQNAKMSAIGHLVRSVAHEINTPIGFIGSNLPHVQGYINDLLEAIDLYEHNCPEPPTPIAASLADLELHYIRQDLPQILASMRSGVSRVADVVRSLQTFARSDEADIKDIDLNVNLERILTLFRQQLEAAEIELEQHYGDLPPLVCYPGQINQVFFNLLTNAIEAIKARQQAGDRRSGCIHLHTRADAHHISIEITDNGSGIPPEYAQHIFDPFFTTKTVGQGTGLGLAACYVIVTEQHHGAIAHRPNPAGGSIIHVRLPLLPAAALA